MLTKFPAILSVLLVLASCSSAGPTIAVRSKTPEVEISVLKGGADKAESLGKLPTTLTTQNFGDGAFAIVELSRAGYQSKKIPIVLAGPGKAASLDIDLDPIVADVIKSQDKCAAKVGELDDAFSRLGRVIELTVNRRFADAEGQALELQTKFPGLSVPHDLLGNIYYLQKRTKDALREYRKSQAISPNKALTQKMIEKLGAIGSGADEN